MLIKFRSGVVVGAMGLTAILLAACGAQTAGLPTTAPSATEMPTVAATPSSSNTTEVDTANNATLGNILVDSQGMTLYIFTKDTTDESTCTGACLTAWPPLTVAPEGIPLTGTGVTATLGMITRSDGTTQVTANHMPVYYFAKDTKPGDVNGQGVNSVWYVLDPAGNLVKTMP